MAHTNAPFVPAEPKPHRVAAYFAGGPFHGRCLNLPATRAGDGPLYYIAPEPGAPDGVFEHYIEATDRGFPSTQGGRVVLAHACTGPADAFVPGPVAQGGDGVRRIVARLYGGPLDRALVVLTAPSYDFAVKGQGIAQYRQAVNDADGAPLFDSDAGGAIKRPRLVFRGYHPFNAGLVDPGPQSLPALFPETSALDVDAPGADSATRIRLVSSHKTGAGAIIPADLVRMDRDLRLERDTGTRTPPGGEKYPAGPQAIHPDRRLIRLEGGPHDGLVVLVDYPNALHHHVGKPAAIYAATGKPERDADGYTIARHIAGTPDSAVETRTPDAEPPPVHPFQPHPMSGLPSLHEGHVVTQEAVFRAPIDGAGYVEARVAFDPEDGFFVVFDGGILDHDMTAAEARALAAVLAAAADEAARLTAHAASGHPAPTT